MGRVSKKNTIDTSRWNKDMRESIFRWTQEAIIPDNFFEDIIEQHAKRRRLNDDESK